MCKSTPATLLPQDTPFLKHSAALRHSCDGNAVAYLLNSHKIQMLELMPPFRSFKLALNTAGVPCSQAARPPRIGWWGWSSLNHLVVAWRLSGTLIVGVFERATGRCLLQHILATSLVNGITDIRKNEDDLKLAPRGPLLAFAVSRGPPDYYNGLHPFHLAVLNLVDGNVSANGDRWVQSYDAWEWQWSPTEECLTIVEVSWTAEWTVGIWHVPSMVKLYAVAMNKSPRIIYSPDSTFCVVLPSMAIVDLAMGCSSRILQEYPERDPELDGLRPDSMATCASVSPCSNRVVSWRRCSWPVPS
ncbi:hypothetical protein WJX84_006306 [Apatococcus fuscideae]|uniref:DUF1618 domain-containing protein n=1 Tax=Apatococcus fuscideae TaxID=2026836 RepID=A0AAW1TCF9_9CHLO